MVRGDSADRAGGVGDIGQRRRDPAAAARAALRRAPATVPVGDRRSLQVLVRPGELESLRRDWRTLHADVGGPSNHLDWWIAFAHAPLRGTRPCVLVVRADGRLVAVAPVFRRRGPLGTVELINRDDASGFLYADEPALRWLIDAVVGLRRPLALRSLVAGSLTESLLVQRARRARYVVLRRSWSMGPTVVVDGSSPAPLDRLSSKRRGELRRRRRRAEEVGAVTFHVDPIGDEPLAQFQRFVRIEGSGWKARQGTSLERDPHQRELLWRFITAPQVRDRVRFASMRLDGVPIAMNLVVVSEQRLWTVKDGYDEAYARFSPGTLLRLHLMSWAAGEGLERVEIMGRMEEWKRSWGEGRALRAVRAYPTTPRGMVALGSDAAAQAWRRLQPRARALLTERLTRTGRRR